MELDLLVIFLPQVTLKNPFLIIRLNKKFWRSYFFNFLFVIYKTIPRYLVFGKAILKGSFSHARVGGLFHEDYKLHISQNYILIFFIAEKKSLQHSYSNPDEIIVIVDDDVNVVVKTSETAHL